MPRALFSEVWRRVCALEGQTFHTITGLPFTYSIFGDTFYPSRTNYAIARSNFETAYELWPLSGPGQINDIVRGPAYVWAVLHDSRVGKDLY